MKDLSGFEKEIRYTFRDKSLLFTALTHSSYANEQPDKPPYNERLEFLGDSVLGVVTADYLFHTYPQEPEGELTRRRAELVCEDSLFAFAKEIHLGDYMRLGKGEERTHGRERPSILADAFEAVIAAIYEDAGIERAREHILRFLKAHKDLSNKKKDYKTMIQEVIQQNREEKLEYVLAHESGPDHDKHFVVELHLNSNVIGTGEGRSKKHAEQEAAHEALRLMGLEE